MGEWIFLFWLRVARVLVSSIDQRTQQRRLGASDVLNICYLLSYALEEIFCSVIFYISINLRKRWHLELSRRITTHFPYAAGWKLVEWHRDSSPTSWRRMPKWTVIFLRWAVIAVESFFAYEGGGFMIHIMGTNASPVRCFYHTWYRFPCSEVVITTRLTRCVP